MQYAFDLERYMLRYSWCLCPAGVPAQLARLVYQGRELSDGASLADCGITHGSTLHQLLRLRGGGQPVVLTVQPRIQKDKWSTYWKESMSTKTDCLDPIQLEFDSSITVGSV